MGAIVDRLTLDLAQVKTFLRVDGDEDDATIQDMIDGAREKADEFCNNFFTDDGLGTGTPQAIPKAVKVWCMGIIGRAYELRTNGVTTDYSRDLSQVIWGPIDYGPIYCFRDEPGF